MLCTIISVNARDSEVFYLPHSVPRNDFETKDSNNKVIPEDNVKHVGQTKFTLSMFSEFFKQNAFGLIRATGLLGCAKDKCDSISK